MFFSNDVNTNKCHIVYNNKLKLINTLTHNSKVVEKINSNKKYYLVGYMEYIIDEEHKLKLLLQGLF